MNSHANATPIVVVTGANGLVGSRVCGALAEAGAEVRALVRRSGTAPTGPGISEHVGEFHDQDVAADVVAGATALVTTVHPLGGEEEVQRTVAVEGTPVIVRAARDAGLDRVVHISTAAVYERLEGTGDVDEHSKLVEDDAGAYPVTKRDTDDALAQIDGITRILVRPPAILGAGETSVWNTIQPNTMRQKPEARQAVPDSTFAWIHVQDLARFVADLATGVIAEAADAEQGPVEGGCTPVNLTADKATDGDYYGAVTEALGVEPTWTPEESTWTGRLGNERAQAWGWTQSVSKDQAFTELRDGITANTP